MRERRGVWARAMQRDVGAVPLCCGMVRGELLSVSVGGVQERRGVRSRAVQRDEWRVRVLGGMVGGGVRGVRGGGVRRGMRGGMRWEQQLLGARAVRPSIGVFMSWELVWERLLKQFKVLLRLVHRRGLQLFFWNMLLHVKMVCEQLLCEGGGGMRERRGVWARAMQRDVGAVPLCCGMVRGELLSVSVGGVQERRGVRSRAVQRDEWRVRVLGGMVGAQLQCGGGAGVRGGC